MPTNDNVLLILDPVVSQTASGLYVSVKETKSYTGEIVGVGRAACGAGIVDESDLGRKAILSQGYEPLFSSVDEDDKEWVIVKQEGICAVGLG